MPADRHAHASVAVSIRGSASELLDTIRRVGSERGAELIDCRRSRSIGRRRRFRCRSVEGSVVDDPLSNRSGSKMHLEMIAEQCVGDVAHRPARSRSPRVPPAPDRRSRRCGRADTGRRGAGLGTVPETGRDVVGVHERERRRRDRLGHPAPLEPFANASAGTHLHWTARSGRRSTQSGQRGSYCAGVSERACPQSSIVTTDRRSDVTSVTAWHATSDAVHDLVPDRAEPIGRVPCG